MSQQASQTPYWQTVCPLEELQTKGRILLRQGKQQIVVFWSQGEAHAIDNRCPHEGYPLIQGELNPEQCTLTCHWHNWKFDLRSGTAKVGQDAVRHYATEIREGQVWVDLSPPDPAVVQAELMRSLRKGFEKRQYGHLARTLARFHYQGLEPLTALAKAIEWSHDKLEFGMGHAYAAAADWIQLYRESESPLDGLTALTEALDHIALERLREPVYAYAEHRAPGYLSEEFLAALEAEDEAQAVALLRAALAAGLGFAELEAALSRAALAHYNDFGHSLIYVRKAEELCRQLQTLENPDQNLPLSLLLSLVRSLIYATREDLIPEFQDYAPALQELLARPEDKRFGPLCQAPDFQSAQPEATAFPTLQGASVKKALRWVLEASRQYSAPALYQTLLLANAYNLLHFDLAYQAATDNPVADNIGWLDFTHALTFANAVRLTCERHPELWPAGLLQMAAFYGRNTPYLERESDLTVLENVSDERTFWQEVRTQLLDHGLGLPIFAAHLLKTAWAVRSESKALPAENRPLLLAALERFLNGPLKERHARRMVYQSLQLVGRDF